MDDGAPTLGVGFLIDPEESFNTLAQLQAVMDSTEARILRDAARIEQATGGMVNLTGATAQITTFGNTTSRELASVARDTNRAEKAGEALVRQLDRQIETFGKSASEIRQMRAEMRAAAAEERGLTELAGRIRMASAEMDRLEAASVGFANSGNRSRGVVAQLIPQFNDLGVQFAMAAQSSNPLQGAMMAMIQQGTQITQIGQQAGVSLGGMAKQSLAAAGSFLIANPAILGTVAAIGAGTIAFNGFARVLENKAPVDDYIKSLGLTAEEAKKLTNTHVTLGDAAGAAWDMIREALGLEDVFSTLNGWVSDSAIWVYGQFKDAAASIYAAMKASYDNIGALWQNLPALLGDAVAATVNEVMNAAQALINDSISKINWLASKSNAIFGTDFGQIKPVSLERYKAQYSAAGKAYAAAFGASFNEGYAEAMGVFEQFEDRALARRNARLSNQAEEIIKDRKKQAEKAAKDEVELANWAADQMAAAYGNVWKLAQDIQQRNLNWGKGEATWGEGDIEASKAADALKQAGIDNMTDAMNAFLASLDKVSDRVDELAANMRRAFGAVGGSIGDVVTVLDEYGKRQAVIDREREVGNLSAEKIAALRKDELNNQLSGMIALTSASKGLFSEHSKGYQAMAAAEKALTVIQLARTAVDVAGGAARMFAMLGPFAFPAVGAMLGVMATLGFGSGGGGSSSLAPTNDGTGTVLGDASAQSDSIKRAIESLKEVDTVMLGYSRQMAASLSSIEDQIGGFAALVLRTGDVNASQGVTEGFKTSGVGSILSNIPIIGGLLGSLFGTKTKVVGSGLYGDAQSLGDILAGGFDASYYSDIQKKKKFFGITTSTKYRTQYADADAGLENQFTLILREFNDAILAAAGPLGLATDAIQQKLNGFVVNIGKIDLQGLTGEEIEEKLTAVFGAAADQMAQAAFPGIERFQQVGEGLFETLVRVSSTVESVTSTLTMLGSSASLMSIDMKMALANQFESLSDFTDAASSYFESYYTAAEQAAARTAQFTDVFESLGLTMPSSLAGFRALVEAQDLTTAAGQATYATLLQLAPAFADLQSALNGAKSAADILSERQDLEKQLLELQGNTAAIREMELAQLDESNRALQQQIWALQDAKEAADAADQLREAWSSIGDSILDEVNRIRGITDGSSGGSFATLMGQFNDATAAARAGDQDAAGQLVSLSQSLLNAASLSATSRQELDRIKAMTAASLEETYAVIAALGGVAGVATSGGAILSGGPEAATLAAAASTAQAAPASASNDNLAAELRALREEVAQMRSENNSGHAANAGNTGAIKRKLEDVTADSGGNAISVAGRAA